MIYVLYHIFVFDCWNFNDFSLLFPMKSLSHLPDSKLLSTVLSGLTVRTQQGRFSIHAPSVCITQLSSFFSFIFSSIYLYPFS